MSNGEGWGEMTWCVCPGEKAHVRCELHPVPLPVWPVGSLQWALSKYCFVRRREWGPDARPIEDCGDHFRLATCGPRTSLDNPEDLIATDWEVVNDE